ncbi:RINT1-like protein MAG2 [Picochlorum sp. SENEW3]|nr:RINT1-like protein MAG2 [Picochlorum sp. SENEW3]
MENGHVSMEHGAKIEDLRQHVSRLSKSFLELRYQLSHESAKLLACFPEKEWPMDQAGRVFDMVEDIKINNACQYYLQYLAELQGLVKSTEKLVRLAQRSSKKEDARSLHIENITNAVDASKKCMSYVFGMDELASKVAENGIDLKDTGHTVRQGAKAVATQTRHILSLSIQRCLRESIWPPPLLPSQKNADRGDEWKGFELAGDAVFGELQQLLVLMTSLQIAIEYYTFSNLDQTSDVRGTTLWIAEEFADPVNAWLMAHFAPKMATCRPEKPEWLFSAALHATKVCIGYMDLFDPCIEAHGIHMYFHMAREFAKSTICGLRKVVRGIFLPLLFDQNDVSYILHYVDEAVKFESNFLALRVDMLLGEEDSDNASHADSMIEVLFDNEEWTSAWINAEQEEAEQRIRGLTNDPLGWKPKVYSDGLGTDDVSTEHLGSLHEFYPPVIVTNSVEILVDLMSRTKYIHSPEHKLVWCRYVVKAALDTLSHHFKSEITRCEQFEHLIDDIGLPIIGGCLNGLHYLEHLLREPSGVLLETLALSPDIDRFLEKETNTLAILRRKWTNKLVTLAMKFIFTRFVQFQLSLADEDDGDSSVRIIELRNQISALLNELSKHLDQVIFREAWKGIAMTTNDSFVEDIQALQGISAHHVTKLSEHLEILTSAFSSFTRRPESYFKQSVECIRLLSLDRQMIERALQMDSAGDDIQTFLHLQHIAVSDAIKLLSKRA